jgi:glycosyltransferase involved in cell wall biosynthesis
MPKISIIVPVYKVETYLHRCLDSIVNQTFTDWECILVDDGSPDNSGKICDEYAEKDKRFKVVHKQNEGVAKARITAFENSTGEFITFIDSDDYIICDALEVMNNCMIKNDVDVAAFSYFDVVNGKNIKDHRPLNGYYDRNGIKRIKEENLLFDCNSQRAGFTLFLWAKIFKRSLLNETIKTCIGFWYAEDAVCFLNTLDNIKTLYISDEPVYYYYHHENEASNKDISLIWSAYEKIWNFYEHYDNGILKEQLAFRIWNFCKDGIIKFARTANNFKQFKNDIQMILKSKYYQNYVLNNRRFKISGMKDRIIYFLFKHKFCFTIYILGKIK